MRTLKSVFLSGMIVVIMVMVSVAGANAKIRCKGPWQLIKGQGKIATPYCGDNYLAKVARGYGLKVSNRAIRNNPNKKREVCRFVGNDIRVSDICAPYNFRTRSIR